MLEVSLDSNGGTAKYTDGNGKCQTVQPERGRRNVLLRRTPRTPTPYKPELGDKKSDTVTVTQYDPAPTALAGDSRDGAAFDVDEYDATTSPSR